LASFDADYVLGLMDKFPAQDLWRIAACRADYLSIGTVTNKNNARLNNLELIEFGLSGGLWVCRTFVGEWLAPGGFFPLNPSRNLGAFMLTLIVDDDPAIRSFVQAILFSEDYETLEAEDGEQALELYKALDRHVDLMITDVQMPGLDGLSLANAVRASCPRTAIILMSGYSHPECIFDFIEKPFSWPAMVTLVRRVMTARARVA
jgi:CheY-like chemotaxis protein